jgi:radical SAM superfamily enzyme YgiQ (UPF0313 family)
VHGEPEGVIGGIVTDILSDGLDEPCHGSLRRRGPTSSELPLISGHNTSLETLPAPAWHLLKSSISAWDRLHDAAEKLPFSLRTSAGCKFQCQFCAGDRLLVRRSGG